MLHIPSFDARVHIKKGARYLEEVMLAEWSGMAMFISGSLISPDGPLFRELIHATVIEHMQCNLDQLEGQLRSLALALKCCKHAIKHICDYMRAG